MTNPVHPRHRLPTGSHHDRAREEQAEEARRMVALWERALFRGKSDAREQLAFWRGVLAELEGKNETGSGVGPTRFLRLW